jgi:two-component system, cell cycle sensor histidine kinase and response regulator CckA
MATPLRVLLLDDDPIDAELNIAALQEGGYDCHWRRVDRRETYVQALAVADFELVLSDYSLPDFDGLTALKLFLQRGLQLPFVLVSGNIGEEVAIESLKAGATDYVLKSRLERLAPVVTRALHEKEELLRRKSAEEALRRSERDLRSLIENAPYGIFRADMEGRFLDVNPALVKMLGYSLPAELLATDPQRDVFLDPVQARQLKELGESQRSFEGLEFEWKRRDGSSVVVRLSGRPVVNREGNVVSFEVMAENVTERRALEEQLRHAQKMEAIGRLAGGVAHDFNNLLMVIIGYTELLRENLPKDGDQRGYADAVWNAGKKATLLTSQLLAFSRKQVISPRVLDLNAVLQEVDRMLPRLIGEDVQLSIVQGANLATVKADPGQMEQVIMNLCVNARDAMPRGGKLRIETDTVSIDSDTARRIGASSPGTFVMLSVTDNGAGMDAQTQSRIFEPFFTTKEKGKGTGLGLATVYGIVKQSGGYITVESELGRGSRFDVYLPAIERSADSKTPIVATELPSRGSETVLLVEDEDAVRSLVREVLRARGYRVLEAQKSAEALEICNTHPGPIDLLVTDVVLPQISGRALAQQLNPARPEMKVLYISGYTDDKMLQHGIPGAAFLQKPFSSDVLARTVRNMLDSKNGILRSAR